MRHIAFVTLAGILAALIVPGPAQAEVLVNVSKSQQRLSVTINGTEAYRWPVSTGRRGYDTPAGKFRPTRLERHWYSRQYEMSPMPWSVFFHRGYAVHGTMEAYNLGHAASHGCVRLRPDNAATLYSLIRRHGMNNTRVTVLNGPLPALPGAGPIAKAEAPVNSAALEHFAQAPAHEEFAAKSHNDKAQEKAQEKAQDERVVHRVSAGNENQVLREREAWLRSLDRKYGIAR
ncbi:MAG: L,D-transpeptidase family protein [Pseudolabrys sp.]